MNAWQPSLLGRDTPSIDPSFSGLVHRVLGRGAWVDHHPGWLTGHETVFESLRHSTRWEASRRQMYDRVVDVPRLTARLPDAGPGHPILATMSAALSDRYGWRLESLGMALYRDGRDSVAWHGDRMGALKPDCVVATVSLGTPRRFLLRPRGGGGSLSFSLGWGDLVVMGGSCQATWEHTVPKAADVRGPRISVMFRPASPRPAPQ